MPIKQYLFTTFLMNMWSIRHFSVIVRPLFNQYELIMRTTLAKYLSIPSFIVLLGAFSIENSKANQNTGKKALAEQYISTLQSTNFEVNTRSLNGAWVAVTYVELLQANSNNEHSHNTAHLDGISVEVVKIKTNNASDNIEFESCNAHQDHSSYALNKNSDSIKLTTYPFSFAKGSKLSAPIMAKIHSNNKIIIDDYTIEYEGEIEKGSTTLIKISDTANIELGMVTVDNTRETAECFYTSQYDFYPSERLSSSSTVKKLSSKTFRFKSKNQEGDIQKTMNTYTSGISEESLNINATSEQSDITLISSKDTTKASAYISNTESPIRYTGNAMILSEQSPHTIYFDFNLQP